MNSVFRRALHAAAIGLLLLPVSAVVACSIPSAMLERRLDIRAAETHFVDESEVRIEVAPDISLRTLVFLPRGMPKVPTILVRAPFPDGLRSRLMTRAVAQTWAKRGYAVVLQGVRGHFGSEGKFVPFVHERHDGQATLAWLRRQPFYNAEVFTWGGSYFGYTQWAIADEPDIRGLFIQIASRDWRGPLHPNGLTAVESALYWSMRDGFTVPSRAQLEAVAASESVVDALAEGGGDTELFRSLISRELLGRLQAEVRREVSLTRISAPVLFLAGWYDPFLEEMLKEFQVVTQEHPDERVRSRSRMIIGPWTHAGEVELPETTTVPKYRDSTVAHALPWFDSLRRDSSPDTERAAVEVFVLGRNEWHPFSSWPPREAQMHSWQLAHKGDLVEAGRSLPCGSDELVHQRDTPAPSAGGASLGLSAGIFSQQPRIEHPDVLHYVSEPLEKRIELGGSPELMLYASANTAAIAEVHVTLSAEHPDGSSYNLSDGAHRLLPRSQQLARPIRLTLRPISRVLAPGTRLRLQVAGSNFPLFAVQDDFRGRVYVGDCAPSRLSLPLLSSSLRNSISSET